MGNRQKSGGNAKKSTKKSNKQPTFQETERRKQEVRCAKMLRIQKEKEKEDLRVAMEKDSMSAVFTNDLLVEKILSSFVTTGCIADIHNCRLVSKSWNDAILKLHRNKNVTLYVAKIDWDSNQPSRDGLLSQFLNILSMSEPMLPFVVKLGPSFFTKTNRAEFLRCLYFFHKHILEIHLKFPLNSSMGFLMPPGLSLPKLQHFAVSFTDDRLSEPNQVNFATIHLVQSILNATDKLESFSIMESPQDALPPDLNELALPSNLKRISIKPRLLNFELLMRPTLNNVTDFCLSTKPGSFYNQDDVNRLLEKLSDNLKSLTLSGSSKHSDEFQLFETNLPKATKLVISHPWRLTTLAPESFPRLEKLVLVAQRWHNISDYLFQNKKLETVKSLVVWLCSDSTPYPNQAPGELIERMPTDVRRLIYGLLKHTFPNVVELTVTLMARSYKVPLLGDLFQYFRGLKVLNIIVIPRPSFLVPLRTNWDGVFMGTYAAPITILESLEKLSIIEAQYDPQDIRYQNSDPSKSFNYFPGLAYQDFLKMPNLRRIRVSDGPPFFDYLPSLKVREEWYQEKRTEIEVVPKPTINSEFYENAKWM